MSSWRSLSAEPDPGTQELVELAEQTATEMDELAGRYQLAPADVTGLLQGRLAAVRSMQDGLRRTVAALLDDLDSAITAADPPPNQPEDALASPLFQTASATIPLVADSDVVELTISWPQELPHAGYQVGLAGPGQMTVKEKTRTEITVTVQADAESGPIIDGIVTAAALYY